MPRRVQPPPEPSCLASLSSFASISNAICLSVCCGNRAVVTTNHWPFAWGEAKHDWILRFDADEFPSEQMKAWLKEFRRAPEPSADVSGFTCIWPLWDGRKVVSGRWPAGRLFLLHRQRVRFFGMCEAVPVPDGRYEAVDIILCHQPKRKSYGVRNILFRKQSWNGADFIARCLQGNPTDLAGWRWEGGWPEHWEAIRRRPIRTAVVRLVKGTFRTLLDGWRAERKLFLEAAVTGSLHQAMTCIEFWRLSRRSSRPKS
jgi:hypothetical protein